LVVLALRDGCVTATRPALPLAEVSGGTARPG
jgi:hypothetical protein